MREAEGLSGFSLRSTEGGGGGWGVVCSGEGWEEWVEGGGLLGAGVPEKHSERRTYGESMAALWLCSGIFPYGSLRISGKSLTTLNYSFEQFII